MNNIDPQYQLLLQDILNNGVEKNTRNGKVLSVFGRQIRHKMSDGFPLLTTKKMYFKGIVTELLWFLRGSTDIRFLWQNNCHIWDGDWYKNYCKYTYTPYSLEEMIKFGVYRDDSFHESVWDLGPIYGAQWRNWNGEIDQISELIKELKSNPDSRRLIVNAWSVHDLPNMVLPPCHYGFQVYTRELSLEERIRLVNYDKENFTSIDKWADWYNNLPEEFYHNGIKYTKETNLDVCQIPKRAISLMWNQRSVDTFLGLPFNIASYGLLLEIIAKEVNMVPDELIGNLGDTHLYLNHVEQAKEQISRTPYELPTLNINTEFWQTESGECGVGPLATNLQGFEISDFQLENYQSHTKIVAPLSN